MKKKGCMSVVKLIVAAFVLALAFSAAPVFATEGGGSHYVGGNEDFMAGALPPPGMYPILYYVNYSVNKFKDKDGSDATAGPNPLGFKLDANALAFRFVYVSKYKLAGADVAWHVIVPLVSQNVKIDAAGVDKKSSGIGDIEFSGPILGWHFSKNMHLIGTIDFMAPTGKYDKMDQSSIGRNYWTIAPIIAPTYISDGGFEASAKFQYFFNTENNDTKYKSGNEFLVDYLIGQHFGNFMVGLNGFYHRQVTDDEVNGVTIAAGATGLNNDAGNRLQSISYGPAVQYNYKNMFFNAKYQIDSNAKNTVEGNKLWLKFMYAF